MNHSTSIERLLPETELPGAPSGQLVYDSIADLIASPDNPTPMVRVSDRFAHRQDLELFVKLERFNPFGSIKDRTAQYLLRNLSIAPGQTLADPNVRIIGVEPARRDHGL